MESELLHRPLPRELRGFAIAFGYAALGALLGGTVAFVFRPYYPVAGQLPLGVVLSQGTNLAGASVVLKDAARESFQHILNGGTAVAFVGNVVGSIMGYRYSMRQG